jgi:hypothetical protein
MPDLVDILGGSVTIGAPAHVASTTSRVEIIPGNPVIIRGTAKETFFLRITLVFGNHGVDPTIESAEPIEVWGTPGNWLDPLFTCFWQGNYAPGEFVIKWGNPGSVNPDTNPSVSNISGAFNGVLNTGYEAITGPQVTDYAIWGFVLTQNGTPIDPVNGNRCTITLQTQ